MYVVYVDNRATPPRVIKSMDTWPLRIDAVQNAKLQDRTWTHTHAHVHSCISSCMYVCM